MKQFRGAPIERVMSRVEIVTESGCWIFMGCLNETGYGIVGLGSRGEGVDRAHRVTYRHFVGEIPKGKVVCHKCDQPACCNPHHLFAGTKKDNTHDMMRKGRMVKPPANPHIVGSVHVLSKLNESDVLQIREMAKEGATHHGIAGLFGVSRSTIGNIVRNKRWKHV